MNDVFLEVSKRDIHFETPKGVFAANRLWKIDLPDLDNIARALNKQIKELSDDSFIGSSTVPKELTLKFEFVKAVINNKQETAKKLALKASKKKKREELLSVLSHKQNEAMQKKSIKALQAELDELDEEEEDND